MTAVVEVRDLSIGWSRDVVLLDHASFDVAPGEIFGILVRSAAGKSTLLRVLAGLEAPFAGSIELHAASRTREQESFFITCLSTRLGAVRKGKSR